MKLTTRMEMKMRTKNKNLKKNGPKNQIRYITKTTVKDLRMSLNVISPMEKTKMRRLILRKCPMN